ncbi:MAG: xanthine dehydrogenase family protein subunit M [Ignavibacteriae bacterium]|nr:MAG: xanthine dehydrogenase family protein subunit M [Ignavibacteriota bacterium]
MRPFEYILPNSIQETLEVLAIYNADAQILAGGTDLLIELRKTPMKAPKAIIDISRLNDLKGITETESEIIIQPLTTLTELGSSPIIKKNAQLLHMAAHVIGSPQIRNRGTIGGNIMNAAACADTVPPLMALEATVKLRSVKGERMTPLADFFSKPYQPIAQKNEILTEIRFPKLHPSAKSAFIKLGRRNALAISRLSVAAILQCRSDGVIQVARIVPGAVFPKWQRVPEAEQLLIGQPPSKDLFAKAGEQVSEMLISFTGRRWSTEYKEPVIAALVRRALEACA